MPTSVRDLPASAFPFTIQMWAAGVDRRGEPSFTATAHGPGGMQIPALGEGAWTRVLWGDGSVQVAAPAGEREADF